MQFQIVQKLKNCKSLLREWCRKKVNNNDKMIEDLMKQLSEIQEEGIGECVFAMGNAIKGQLKECWDKEMQYWHQRSRIN